MSVLFIKAVLLKTAFFNVCIIKMYIFVNSIRKLREEHELINRVVFLTDSAKNVGII